MHDRQYRLQDKLTPYETALLQVRFRKAGLPPRALDWYTQHGDTPGPPRMTVTGVHDDNPQYGWTLQVVTFAPPEGDWAAAIKIAVAANVRPIRAQYVYTEYRPAAYEVTTWTPEPDNGRRPQCASRKEWADALIAAWQTAQEQGWKLPQS